MKKKDKLFPVAMKIAKQTIGLDLTGQATAENVQNTLEHLKLVL